jgi:hypothetical protein
VGSWGFGSMTFGLKVQKVRQYQMISSLKIKLNRKLKILEELVLNDFFTQKLN